MKKVIVSIIALSEMILLAGCQWRMPVPIEQTTTIALDKNTVALKEFETLGSVEVHIPPNDITNYAFPSYEALISHFSSIATAENSVVQAEKSQHGEKYESLVDAFTTSKELVIPMAGGKPLPFRSGNGTKVSLWTEEAFGLPLVWYNCNYDGQYVSFRIICPSAMTGTEYGADATCQDVMRGMGINQNSEEDQTVYSTEIQLADKTVSAVVRDTTRVYLYFDDLLVIVASNSSILEDASFWNALSFEPLS